MGIKRGVVLNSRERFVNYVNGKSTDRIPFVSDGLWKETVVRWQNEGMEKDHDFGYDFTFEQSWGALGVNYGYLPPYCEDVIEDRGDTVLVTDRYGIKKLEFKNGSSMPMFVSFPLEDSEKDWPVLREKLSFNGCGRFAENWKSTAEQAVEKGIPITLGQSHLCGFFSLLREMAGDRCYYMFYDEPELVHEIMEFQKNRIIGYIETVTAQIAVDRLFIWEDMCYNHGPLISPETFKEFLLKPYTEVVNAAKKNKIPIVDVDSDGNTFKLMPLWLEAGINLFHPFEVAAGMDVNEVRKEFGTDFAIRGGVDKRPLAFGKDAIDAELDRLLPVIEKGRYIPHIDHSVPPNVSFENYLYYLEQLKAILGF